MSKATWVDYLIKPLVVTAWLGCMGLFVHFLLNEGSSENKWLTFFGSFLLLVCTRLADIIKINVGKDGFTTEMQEAIRDAKATVSQLQDIAELFGKISVQQIAGAGRWGGPSEREKREMIERITNGLRTIDVTDAKIKAILAVQEPWNNIDYCSFVTQHMLPDGNQEAVVRWNEFFRPFTNGRSRPSPDQIEQFANANNLMTDDIRERLADWRHYQQHKTHRRPVIWEARKDREW